MSYRAFKHLLGETSLERKCRFLFGAGSFLLITASFVLYALKTESLAYDQVNLTGRLLVNPIVARLHLQHVNVTDWEWQPAADANQPKPKNATPLRAGQWQKLRLAFYETSEEHLPEVARQYQYRIIRQPDDDFETKLLNDFADDPAKNEAKRDLEGQWVRYYGAVRATKACISCHQDDRKDLKVGDLMAVVKIRLNTTTIESRIHGNRAMLMALYAFILFLGCVTAAFAGGYVFSGLRAHLPVRIEDDRIVEEEDDAGTGPP